jgi:hypothetical protein
MAAPSLVARRRSFGIGFALLVCVLLLVAFLVRNQSNEELQSRGVTLAHPPGQEISQTLLTTLIQQRGGPQLPPGVSVSRAWQEATVSFGAQLGDGSSVTYSPDTRSPQQAASDFEAMIQADETEFGSSQFSTVSLRGTTALSHEQGADGPASLSWIEGQVLIQIIGYPGESLADLIPFAQQMP